SWAANTHQGPGSEIAQNEPGYISASMLYRSSNYDCRRWADHTFAEVECLLSRLETMTALGIF
ncbi:hypothetical protein, partial [Pseudomonas viridiflava]